MRLFEELGQGSYGTVYNAGLVDEKPAVAKIMSLDDLESIVREVIFLQILKGTPGVPEVYGFHSLYTQKFAIVMKRYSKLERNQCILGSLVTVANALHQRNVLHRDISPNNVMGSPDGLVLVDFGMATFVGQQTCRRRFSTCVTTITTRAPEIAQARGDFTYGPEVDLWSCAATALHYQGVAISKEKPSDETYKERVLDVITSQAEQFPLIKQILLERKPLVMPVMIPRLRDASEEHKDLTIYPTYVLEMPKLQPVDHDHFVFGNSLYDSFCDLLPETHCICLQARTDALSKTICTGECRLTGCASFAINVFLHVRHKSIDDLLAQYAKTSVHQFRLYTAHVLASQDPALWISDCCFKVPRNGTSGPSRSSDQSVKSEAQEGGL